MENPRSNFGAVVASWLYGPCFVGLALGMREWLSGDWRSQWSVSVPALIIGFSMWLRWSTARESEYLQDTVDKLRTEVKDLRLGRPVTKPDRN